MKRGRIVDIRSLVPLACKHSLEVRFFLLEWCRPCLTRGRGQFPAIAKLEGTPECEYCHRGEARPDVARPLSLRSPEAKPDIATILVTRPPCACGCGDLVVVVGERYIPGHRPRQVVVKPEEPVVWT